MFWIFVLITIMTVGDVLIVALGQERSSASQLTRMSYLAFAAACTMVPALFYQITSVLMRYRAINADYIANNQDSSQVDATAAFSSINHFCSR
jgi:hypothetical protein